MIVDYSPYALGREIEKFNNYKVNYVFQPIVSTSTGDVFAYEALMRPQNIDVRKLLDGFSQEGQLHLFELATFFGAAQSYEYRGYKEKLAINSLPSESFTITEAKKFVGCFGNISDKIIIENLSYPRISKKVVDTKKRYINRKRCMSAIDGFGMGYNGLEVLEWYNPDIVKIDRVMFSDITETENKQRQLTSWLSYFHKRNILVVAKNVETKEEFDYLSGVGVDYLQGYYIGKPE